jgi:hypothetical protein
VIVGIRSGAQRDIATAEDNIAVAAVVGNGVVGTPTRALAVPDVHVVDAYVDAVLRLTAVPDVHVVDAYVDAVVRLTADSGTAPRTVV